MLRPLQFWVALLYFTCQGNFDGVLGHASNFSNWEASTTFLDLTTRKCPFCTSCLLQKKKKFNISPVENFCWVCRWKGSVPIYSTTRAEQAFEPHHYSDSFLLNMKWFCGQPEVSRSQLNREQPATPLLISIDKKFASPLCPVSLRRRRRKQDLERGLSYLKGVQRASKGMPKFYLTSELWQSF